MGALQKPPTLATDAALAEPLPTRCTQVAAASVEATDLHRSLGPNIVMTDANADFMQSRAHFALS